MIRKIVLTVGVVAGVITLAVMDTQHKITKAVHEAWKQ